MAASFLQYCATCEKQILVPNNAILYCSESCRRKDSAKPMSVAFTNNAPAFSPSDPLYSPPPYPQLARDIIPPASPTSPAKVSPFAQVQSHDIEHSPPEYPGASPLLQASSPPSGNRPALISRTSNSTAPSLSSTLSSSYQQSSTRTLPPRHHPSYSYSASSPRSISLVTPSFDKNAGYGQYSSTINVPSHHLYPHHHHHHQKSDSSDRSRHHSSDSSDGNHPTRVHRYEKTWNFPTASGITPSGVAGPTAKSSGAGSSAGGEPIPAISKSESSVALDGRSSLSGEWSSSSAFLNGTSEGGKSQSQGVLGRLLSNAASAEKKG
ncbi:MAG: hypothetical protein M4579_001361 [Chaenotheca gracillima]|nr:MAG: hypothetical protein M4579_001361 [Chaenotheca gracillima]